VVIRNVVAVAPPPALLGVEQTLARDAVTNEIVASVAVTNTGGTAASNVVLTSILLGSSATITTLPIALGDIAPGATATAVVRFPGTLGPPGMATVLRVVGTFADGTLGGSFRVVLP
jgi:hypothetical protein